MANAAAVSSRNRSSRRKFLAQASFGIIPLGTSPRMLGVDQQVEALHGRRHAGIHPHTDVKGGEEKTEYRGRVTRAEGGDRFARRSRPCTRGRRGSLLTRCWREADSNPRFLQSHSQGARNEGRETDPAPSERLFVQVGLRVRIRLPPPVSPSQRGPPGRCRPKSRLWRGSGPALGRERGTSWRRPEAVGSVSLMGVDAVPLRQRSNRSQPRVAPR